MLCSRPSIFRLLSTSTSLRELAFAERVKMHAIVMEGLDLLFRERGLRSIADLTSRP